MQCIHLVTTSDVELALHTAHSHLIPNTRRPPHAYQTSFFVEQGVLPSHVKKVHTSDYTRDINVHAYTPGDIETTTTLAWLVRFTIRSDLNRSRSLAITGAQREPGHMIFRYASLSTRYDYLQSLAWHYTTLSADVVTQHGSHRR